MVIKELTEKINKKEFQKILSHEKNNSVLQRLGFILYYIGLKDIAKIVEKELSKRKIQFILLVPHLHNKSSIRNEQFKMIVNDTIEVEE